MKKKAIGLVGLAGVFLTLLAFPLRAEILKVTLRVDGLACPFCAYGLEKNLKKVKGIEKLKVEMKKGKARLVLSAKNKVTVRRLKRAVKEAGFTLRSAEIRALGYFKGKHFVVSKTKESFSLEKTRVSEGIVKIFGKVFLTKKGMVLKELRIENGKKDDR